MPKKKIYYIVESALISALYIGLTLIGNLLGLSFGHLQFRISEVLVILPIFTPSAISGLAVGCFISNITSSLGPVDMLFGTLATLIAAMLTYYLRKITVKGFPVFSFLPAIVINALIIGMEINIFLPVDASVWGFVMSALSVGAGEAAVCIFLGIPLYFALKKYGFTLEKQHIYKLKENIDKKL